MTILLNALQKKHKEYQTILNQAELRLSDAPEGRLRISGTGNQKMLYHTDADQHSSYIRRKDITLAEQLAQKTYDQRLVREIQAQLPYMEALLQHYDPGKIVQLYEDLNPVRQSLINPAILPTEAYIENWFRELPEGTNSYPITGDFYTEKNEHVRSKSEMILANKFYYLGIPYRYEAPLILTTDGLHPSNRTIYPDFTLLNPNTRRKYYWEHLGMMDSEDYMNDALQKLDIYAKNGIFPGINLILTFESGTHPLNMKVVDILIHRFLQ